MKLTDLERGQSLLVLRFSIAFRADIIDQHKKLIEKQGYVWYGKFSGKTSSHIITETFSAKRPALILYSKSEAYLCEVKAISNEKPKGGYPNYYDEEYLFPTSYYCLTSMESINNDVIKELFVKSSKRSLASSLSKQCNASSFFVSYKEV